MSTASICKPSAFKVFMPDFNERVVSGKKRSIVETKRVAKNLDRRSIANSGTPYITPHDKKSSLFSSSGSYSELVSLGIN